MTERERFESWARQRWTHPEDFDQRIKAPSKYNNCEVQAAWDAWQERAAQPAPSVPDHKTIKDLLNKSGLCAYDREGDLAFMVAATKFAALAAALKPEASRAP